MLYLFDKILKWRTLNRIIPVDEVEFQWEIKHLKIVREYYSRFRLTCDFGELPATVSFLHNLCSAKPKISSMYAKIAESFTQQLLPHYFMVPRLRLDKFHQTNHQRVKKFQLLEAFLSFLLQLLNYKIKSFIDFSGYKIYDLVNKLTFIQTSVGSSSLILLCDDCEDEGFQKLLAEFEAMASEAGCFVHSLFFLNDRGLGKGKEDLGAVLNHFDLLNDFDIMKFFCILSSVNRSRSAFTTPKTSVVNSFLVVVSLIHNLEDLMNRDDNPIADVMDPIKTLHQGLICLQSFIKDIDSLKHSEIGELKEPLGLVADMTNQVDYLITSFVVGDAAPWYLIRRITEINHRIDLIWTELRKITNNYIGGSLQVAKYFSSQLSLRDKTRTEVDDGTVCFEDKETYVLDKLVGGGSERQLISIFGMPGLGKTTLAKKLYNHPCVNDWFDKRAWCVISQTYQTQSILANILIHLTSEPDKDRILRMEEESLVVQIHKTLMGRRYLIVMDDIWDSNVGDSLVRFFPDDGNGSRVLITTRNKDVVPPPPNSIIYEMPSLSDDQCWELLKKKLFGSEPCPSELIGIGKKIAANCHGLPLAVVVVAGILSTMDRETSRWEEVEGNLASYFSDGGENSSVMQIMELSYKHLPLHLKPCFLYFGAFEEDEEIPARKLMKFWIAEGFVHREEEKSAEDIAEKYLTDLIDKSLVMVSKRRSDGGVKACIVHDLLLDLCLKACEEENFIRVEDDIYSIDGKGYRPQDLVAAPNPDQGQSKCTFSAFYSGDMKLLRVLDFKHFDVCYMGIEFMINLRYLVIGCHIPSIIDKLANLEYLHLRVFVTISLPKAVVKMRKLRYIKVVFANAIYDEDCKSSLQENKLEYLSGIVIRDETFKDEEMLKCSPHLRTLKCRWDPLSALEMEEYRSDKMLHKHFYLSFLTQLDSLTLTSYSLFRVNVEEIRFPPNIKKLSLNGEFRMPWEKMSMIGRLKNLEVLKIDLNSFEGERWDTSDGEFQNLKYLRIFNPTLIQWAVDSRGHFPKLQRLVLRDCYRLQEIPSEIGEIPALELIEIRGRCPASLVESAKNIQQEQLEMGNEELRVIDTTAALRRKLRLQMRGYT